MKELDKSQVYSLKGITYQQAEEIAVVLSEIHKEWRPRGTCISFLMNSEYLVYTRHMWCHGSGDQTPTASILDLFEKQTATVEDLIRQRDELNKRIEEWNKPVVGDVCKFWDDDCGKCVIGIYNGLQNNYHRTTASRSGFFNAKKLTQQEVIDLLFTKKGDV